MQPDARNAPPTAQTGEDGTGGGMSRSDADWLRIAKSAYQISCSYFDTVQRKDLEDSIRAFNNQHPSDSKYEQPSYAKRSRLYRPKIRTVLRKHEAAAAAAFFSNVDSTSVTAQDQASKVEVASADIMKQLLEYRLKKSIPWYLIVLGGLQDAMVSKVSCAHIYWKYRERKVAAAVAAPDDEYPEQSQMPQGAGEVSVAKEAVPVQAAEVIDDKPCIDLIPIENLRIDPSANWMDPVNTSPYIIHLMPVYVQELRSRIAAGEWDRVSESNIVSAIDGKSDSTRMTRNQNHDPATSDAREIRDYEIVWVQRHIHRHDDCDYEFYTLHDVAMLAKPRELKEVVLHGKRPYVIGNCVIESHKLFPASMPQLGKGLSDESNEISNQRSDNVKFVLNKKYFIKRGKNVDVAGLVRNVPGGVIALDDPEKDVKESTWTDVTASAFEEQGRVDRDFDELLGNFNPAQLMATGGMNSPARNMALLGQSNGMMVEYTLRTYVETFIQPVLRQLMLLEQHYETDRVVLALAGKRAEVYQKFGIDAVTDELLQQELTLSVNVGMGATDPMMKLQKFLAAMGNYNAMLVKPAPGVNMQEVGKEIFGLLGYGDASRFFTTDDPGKLALQQQVQQQGQLIQALQMKLKEKSTGFLVKAKASQEANQTKIATTQIHEANENKRALAAHIRALAETANAAHGQARAVMGRMS